MAGSNPAGHVPRRGPALDMSLGGLKSRRACPRRGPALDMSLGGLSRHVPRAGQGWAYWRYAHCPGPTLGISRIGTEVSAHAREGTSRGVRESCGTCHLARASTGHVPWRAQIPQGMSLGAGQGLGILASCPLLGTNTGHIPRRGRGLCAPKKARPAECVNPAAYVRPRGPTLDMSTGGAKSRWACPTARARDGHIGIMSIARLQRWACPAWGTGSLRTPGKARSAELVNPAAHVPPRGPRMGMSRGAGRTAHPRLPAPSAALSRTSINLRGRIDSRATGQAWARSALV